MKFFFYLAVKGNKSLESRKKRETRIPVFQFYGGGEPHKLVGCRALKRNWPWIRNKCIQLVSIWQIGGGKGKRNSLWALTIRNDWRMDLLGRRLRRNKSFSFTWEEKGGIGAFFRESSFEFSPTKNWKFLDERKPWNIERKNLYISSVWDFTFLSRPNLPGSPISISISSAKLDISQKTIYDFPYRSERPVKNLK